MTLYGLIERIPEDQADGGERQTDDLSAEADTYEAAFAQLRASVPEGWRLMNVRRGE